MPWAAGHLLIGLPQWPCHYWHPFVTHRTCLLERTQLQCRSWYLQHVSLLAVLKALLCQGTMNEQGISSVAALTVSARSGVKRDRQLHIPKNRWTPSASCNGFMPAVARRRNGRGVIPLLLRNWPIHVTFFTLKWNFFGFNLRLTLPRNVTKELKFQNLTLWSFFTSSIPSLQPKTKMY